ncbi:hypothetical protein HanPSC8_Chr16g0695121 [Helianthus annuus]|nr:hypothetical protein HanPSC8_Chr16g0695121 [Helianthus annuus]
MVENYVIRKNSTLHIFPSFQNHQSKNHPTSTLFLSSRPNQEEHHLHNFKSQT